jgi:hypothetical protein
VFLWSAAACRRLRCYPCFIGSVKAAAKLPHSKGFASDKNHAALAGIYAAETAALPVLAPGSRLLFLRFLFRGELYIRSAKICVDAPAGIYKQPDGRFAVILATGSFAMFGDHFFGEISGFQILFAGAFCDELINIFCKCLNRYGRHNYILIVELSFFREAANTAAALCSDAPGP